MKLRSAIYLASAAFALAVLTLASTLPSDAADKVDPVADAKAFRKFFTDKFPKVKLEDFVNGPYSMNEDLHRQWQEKEQFPPYEFSLEMGKEMFSKPFKNGKSYADCFPNGGIGVRQNYPYFDEKEGKVITLELALNRCREANGEPPYSYVKDEMAALTAYMAFTARGRPMNIATSSIICPMSATGCRFPARERGHEEPDAEIRIGSGNARRGRDIRARRRLRGRVQGGLRRG